MLYLVCLAWAYRNTRVKEKIIRMLGTFSRFGNLHSGIYHDEWQVQMISKLASSMATAAGFSRKSLRFLAQASLFCNADERYNSKTGERLPLSLPHAFNTLDWMLENKDWICNHHGWTKHNFNTACLLMARSIVDFNDKPCQVGKSFYGKSPLAVVSYFLSLLPSELRAEAMSFALILNFSNQIANFAGNWKRAISSIDGLVRELQHSQTLAPARALDIDRLLREAGSNITYDRSLAIKYGVPKGAILDRDALFQLLPASLRRRLESNMRSLADQKLAA